MFVEVRSHESYRNGSRAVTGSRKKWGAWQGLAATLAVYLAFDKALSFPSPSFLI